MRDHGDAARPRGARARRDARDDRRSRSAGSGQARVSGRATGLTMGSGGLGRALRLPARAPALSRVELARAGMPDWAVIHRRLARAEVLARYQRQGIRTMVWTVNADADLARWVAAPGVDALVTDRPARAIFLRRQQLSPCRALRPHLSCQMHSSRQARTGGRRWPAPGGFCSGVDRCAGPAVQAQRLHDGERRGGGENLDVRGGQHAGVLGDDGRSRALGDFVEVALNPCPGVLSVLHGGRGERLGRGQRLP